MLARQWQVGFGLVPFTLCAILLASLLLVAARSGNCAATLRAIIAEPVCVVTIGIVVFFRDFASCLGPLLYAAGRAGARSYGALSRRRNVEVARAYRTSFSGE